MQNNLIRGQKIVIGKLNRDNPIKIQLKHLTYKGNVDIDLFVFPIKNQFLDKKDIIYFNNPFKTNSILLKNNYCKDRSIKELHMNLRDIEDDFDKIILGLSYYKRNISTEEIQMEIEGTEKILKSNIFNIKENLIISNNSIILGEIYKYKDQWKFNTILYESESFIMKALSEYNNIMIK